jgi:hypothetical protein
MPAVVRTVAISGGKGRQGRQADALQLSRLNGTMRVFVHLMSVRAIVRLVAPAMSTERDHIELGGLPRFGGFSDWSERVPASCLRSFFRWLPVLLVAGLAAGLIWLGSNHRVTASEAAEPAIVAVEAPASPARVASPEVASREKPAQAVAGVPTQPADPPAVNGLSISSQSWRRGGLGSQALVNFTLRNNNDYAVKDIELVCAFTRRDGSHLTDRKRVIPDTVAMRSRKTFAHMLMGFVNINASRANCVPVAASRT